MPTGHYSNECEEKLPKTSHKRQGTSLHINKEESSDEELGSVDKYFKANKENINEDNHQDRNSNASDDDKMSDYESYEEDDIFSEDDYEVFAFIQDIACNMNDKVGIPDSWILLDSQST